MNVVILKLRFYNNLQNMTVVRKNEIELGNNKFRRTWARLFLANRMRDKIEKICLDVMISFEINKKIKILDNTKPPIVVHNPVYRQLNVLNQMPDYDELIKETFRRKLAEVKKSFAKHFILTILRPNITSKNIKKDLNSLIVDTIFHLTCGVIQEVNLMLTSD